MITHTVLMAFTDPADAPEAKRLLEALPAEIEQLTSLWVGLDLVGTEASYDLALITTHDDLAGLTGYQQHPAHVAFLGWLRPRLRARAVVDAES